VVIGIICILAGLLLPALQKAKNEARKTVCASNLKNFGTAISLYMASNSDKYPPWLSNMLPNELGMAVTKNNSNTKALECFLCPMDKSRGHEGGRPDWITTGSSQYAETNDQDATAATPEDGGFSAFDRTATNGGLSAYYSQFPVLGSARPSEGSRDTTVKGCSYLYEFTLEKCSWNNSDGSDGYPAKGATWQECKLAEIRGIGDDPKKKARVPSVRCFWHIPNNQNGALSDTDPLQKEVRNVNSMGNNVYISFPGEWWGE